MTTATSYETRRGEIETYFDRTAADTWKKLTSDAPVSGIRATVRAGRDRMRAMLLSWLPEDLSGRRVLDAGCGTGAMSVALAERGAEVVAIDLSATLVDIARERAYAIAGPAASRIIFGVGDMRAQGHGRFDHVVAMDVLIHYRLADKIDVIADLTDRADRSVLFTFAPRTPALAAMHTVGKLFPKSDRAPAIEPVAPAALSAALAGSRRLAGWRAARTERVASGFYTSQAMELVVA